MENYKGGLKSYWKKRNYHRVEVESGHRRTRRSRIELGGRGARRRKSFWRIKVSPRLRIFSRIRNFSPRRILARIRDGYVRMMLSVAGSGAISGGGFGYAAPHINGFGRSVQGKEYDEKMIVQIYRTLVAQSQIGGGGAGADSAGSVVPRIAA